MLEATVFASRLFRSVSYSDFYVPVKIDLRIHAPFMRFASRVYPLRVVLRLPCNILSVRICDVRQHSIHQAPCNRTCPSRCGTQRPVSHGLMPPRLSFCLYVLPIFYVWMRKKYAWFGLPPMHILLLPLWFACCHGWCVSFFFTCALIVAGAYPCP